MLKEAVDVSRDEKAANMFLGLIKRDYPRDRRPLLRAQLTVSQWRDLKRLVAIVKSGKVESDFAWADKLEYTVTAKKKLPWRERKMARLILKNRLPLQEALGIESLRDVKPEQQYGEFGRADLLAVGDRVGFPIELKDETSNERLSGQIFKYVKGAIRYLKYGFYDTVQGVTIAPGYSQEAANQLKAYGIWVYVIEIEKDDYKLTRID